MAFPVVGGPGSSDAGAASITATAGGAVGHTSVTSASWGSIPTTLASGTVPTGSLTETFPFTILLSPAPAYFFAYNSGNMSLVGTTYTVMVSQSGGLAGSAVATLTACVGATWTTGGFCSTGNHPTIGTWTIAGSGTSVNTTTVPSAAGSRLSIQLSISGIVLSLGSVTVVVNTNVDNTTPRQIRAAAITNA